jgi:uncharacterized protein (DUF1800 family)
MRILTSKAHAEKKKRLEKNKQKTTNQPAKQTNIQPKNEEFIRANNAKTECREIEPNPPKENALHEGNNPSFSDEFIKPNPFLTF